MIRYALVCEQEHPFEGWFGSSADYDDQAGRGLVECPFCGSRLVRKQIMAPAVAGTKGQSSAPAPDVQAQTQAEAMMREVAGRVRKHVEENFEHVGDRFAQEASDIHEGLSAERGIYGEATPQQVKELLEDGVKVAPVPGAPKPKAGLN